MGDSGVSDDEFIRCEESFLLKGAARMLEIFKQCDGTHVDLDYKEYDPEVVL